MLRRLFLLAALVLVVPACSSNRGTFLLSQSPPIILTVAPPSVSYLVEAAVGTPLRIVGTSFGGSQGSSTVTIHGQTVSVTSWTNTEIDLTVPATATTGPLLVTVDGVDSNAASFVLLWSVQNPINEPISTAGFGQSGCQVISDGAGGAIIAWQDARSGVDVDIYAQRVNGSGVPQWAANGVAICTAASDQTNCQLVSDGAGGAIITWQDFRNAADNDIYAQRVNASGAVQWAANGIPVCTAAGNQTQPQLVADGIGGAVLTWLDNRTLTSLDIYAQQINASGIALWTVNGVALSTIAGAKQAPHLVTDNAGGAIVAWGDFRNTVDNDIYAQRVNILGTPMWTADGVPISTATGDQLNCRLVADGVGGAIIAWQDHRSGTDFDLYAQRISSGGAVQWTADGIPLCAAAGDQINCQLTGDGAGGAIVAWQDHRSGTTDDIYAQRVNPSGVVLWIPDGVAIAAAAGDQQVPQLTGDGAGGAIIAWQDHRSGTTFDLYAQRVNPLGAVQWTVDGVAVSTAPGDQINLQLAADGAGGAILAWEDSRSGPTHLYAQGISSSGQ